MTETKKEFATRIANIISNLVSIGVLILFCRPTLADSRSETDFGVSENLMHFPSRETTEFLFQGHANWIYEFATFKSQTKISGVWQKSEEFHDGYIDCAECYIQYSTGAQTLRLGWQLVHWGITDGYNPLNRINSRAYFTPIHPIDQGELMLNWSFTGEAQQFQLLWLPEHRQSFLPNEKSLWLPRRIYQTPGETNVQALIPEEFSYNYSSRNSLNRAERNNLGLQWSMQKSNVELALNYYDGIAGLPLFRPTVTGTVLDADPDHTVIQVNDDLQVDLYDYRIQNYGGSFLWSFDNFIFKWEGLLTYSVGNDPALPPRTFEQVVAFEKNWNVGRAGMLTSVFQYSHINTPEPPESRTLSALSFFEQTGMLGIRYNWNEKWTLTGFSAVQFKNHAKLNELSLAYATDRSEYSLNGTAIDGPDESLLGLWRDNDFISFSFKFLF